MAKKPTYADLERKIKHLEAILSESRQKDSSDGLSADFKRFAQHSQDVIYRYDIPTSKFLFLNRSGTEYGYGTKKTTLLLIHPDDREKVRQASNDSLAPGRESGEVEYRICPHDGSVRWMHDRWIVIRDNAGHPLAIEGVIRDYTARRIAEEALQKSEVRYRTVVETMNEGLLVIDANYVLTYVNEKLCEMLGFSNNELIGNPVLNFFERAQQGIFMEQMSKRKRGERGHYELTWIRSDKSKIYTIVSGQPVLDDNGNYAGSFGVITNISHQKKVEQILKERERELETKTSYLEELNAALKILLKRREEDKDEIEQNVVSNVKELVAPYLIKLKSSRMDERQKTYVSILETNLEEIISPFLNRVSVRLLNLTPTETQVANFVKQGKTTKEIADIMGLSPRTIESHRENIRNKLGIKNKKSNLRTHLLSYQTKKYDPEILSVF